MDKMTLQEKCLQKGYSISTPIGGSSNDVAFVAYSREKYIAIMFMNYIDNNVGEWEKYYRESYPHIKYYRRIITPKPRVELGCL